MTSTPLPIYQPAIVPALQRIQAEHGYLAREVVERFAKETATPLYRLQAVASFFPHFHLSPPPRVTLRVCRDMACHLAGSGQMLQRLGELAGEHVRVEGVSCLGRCDRAPAACFAVQQTSGGNGNGADHDHDDERYFLGRSTDELLRIAASSIEGKGLRPKEDRDADLAYAAANWAIDPYQGAPGTYDAVKKAVEAARSPDGWADALLAELDAAKADLRGMGGAGIPATQKWRDVRDAVRSARRRKADERAFIVVNGDESEPGTFKDRELLLRCPHVVIEGMILAAMVTEASQGFIYIRHEYGEQIEACRREIARAEALGICGVNATALGRPLPISVFVSPGGYICGEQSALIEAMSDRRAEPRNLPPKLETNGLDDQPTLVSNVETFAWTPNIYLNGGEAYAKHGANGWRGRRFFSVSGDVVRPGVYEVPMGLTLRELIHGEQYCRGIIGGKKLKAFAPSGPSGGFLPAKLTAKSGLPRKHTERKEWIELAKRRGFDPAAQELDILDLELELNLFRALSPTQSLGAGLVVYAEGRDMAEQAVNAMQFFRNESCGKCVPCRIGSQKLAALGENLLEGKVSREMWETVKSMVGELGEAMVLASICGLGRSVPVPLRTVMEFFPGDLAGHLGMTPSGDVTAEARP